MTLTKDIQGLSKSYKGKNGEAVITRNFGNKDKKDNWSVSVVVNGEYKKLANRIPFQKAYQMAEMEID